MELFKKFEKVLVETVNGFKEISNFGYLGLIGSANTKKDIDILALPSPKISLGIFIKTNVHFLEKLNKNLRRNKIGLVVFTHEYHQDEVEWISKDLKKSLKK